MVKIRNTEVYKYIDDSKTCYKDIHQNIPIGQNDSLKSEQYGCIDMQCVLTMGTYVLIFVQRIWCYLFLKGSATMKYLGVLNQEANFQFHRGRNKQMEIEPINFRDILESFLDPWCRVFCFKDFSSGFSIYSREAKPIQQRRRCFSGIMEGP